MNSLVRLHADERGFVVVAVIALVAILFLGGTAMALAVQSNLHTNRTIAERDAVNYAAESAVARGVSDSVRSLPDSKPSCSGTGTVNGQSLTIDCRGFRKVKKDAIQQWATPPRVLDAGGCIDIGLGLLPPPSTLWTVIGWRKLKGNPSMAVWVDSLPSNCTPPAETKFQGPGTPYFPATNPLPSKPTLHVKLVGGSGSFAPIVVRGSKEGSDCVATVVGVAGAVAKEADVLMTGCNSKKPQVTLWKSALP